MKKVGILGFAHGHVFAYGGQWLAAWLERKYFGILNCLYFRKYHTSFENENRKSRSCIGIWPIFGARHFYFSVMGRKYSRLVHKFIGFPNLKGKKKWLTRKC